MKRWVATAKTTVAELLGKQGIQGEPLRAALAGGRLFVGRQRVAAADAQVMTGDEVFLHPPPRVRDLPEPFVLAEGAGLVAVHKPAGMTTIADLRGQEGCLVDRVASELGIPFEQLHVTSRLDREVSGVVFIATTPKARELAAETRARGAYQRRYVALVAGLLPERFTWTWSIGRASSPRLRRAASSDDPSALAAKTLGRVVQRNTLGERGQVEYALLALAPQTGRTHQLRVHAAAAGAPMLGDVDYGASRRLVLPNGRILPFARVALHCARVDLPLDLGAGGGTLPRLVARAPISPELRELGSALGLGELEEATTCDV